MSDELLAAGFSAVLGQKVMTQVQFDDYKLTPEGQNAVAKKLTLDEVYQTSLQRNDDKQYPVATKNISASELQSHGCPWKYQLFAKCDSKTLCVSVYHCTTIAELKRVIAKRLDSSMPEREIRLTYRDKDLDDSKTVGDYHIENNSNINVLLRVRGGEEVAILDSTCRDPGFDYDFSNITDSNKYYRGNHEYFRPCGWKRLALRVRGKYDDDTWLGEQANRTQASPGEWLVSYHGTARKNTDGIVNEGFRLDKGVRFAYGEGIYSSPYVATAEGYAAAFDFNDEQYKLVFQNRCNPDDIREAKFLFFSTSYWITENDRNIRPYGICLKKCSASLCVMM